VAAHRIEWTVIEKPTARSPARHTLCAWIGVVALACWLPGAAHAQVRLRVLRELEVRETAGGWDLRLELDVPVRYLRHSPVDSGRLLRILVERLDVATPNAPGLQRREVLPLPRDREVPIVEIAFDRSSSDGPFIEIQFSREMAYRVSQGQGLRSLRIVLTEPGEKAAAGPRRGGPDGGHAEVLLERARRSIRDGDLDLAIALLTKILESGEGAVPLETRQDAQELLGVAHERRGQEAHARAEYQAYLDAYPDGPGAERVRQRLEALVTAGAAPRPALREPETELAMESSGAGGRPVRTDFFGSLAATYFRTESLPGADEGRDFTASDILVDLDLAARIDADDWVVRTDVIGTYDVDLESDDRTNDLRFSRLSVEVEDRLRGIDAIVGRQGRSDSGVLGRFDGVRVAYQVGSHYALSALVGLPVESTSDSKPNTDTVMAGAALDADDFWIEGLRGQLFVIGQNTDSMTDRTAIGGELRYADRRFYAFSYLDYDVVFGSLNSAVLSGTWYWRPETDFRVLAERRNSPVVTLASALQGRAVEDLDELRTLFSESEIRDMAVDRVVQVTTGSVGVTHRPTERLQVSADFAVSHASGTQDSDDGLVLGVDAMGPDFNTSLQLLVSDWLVDGGVGSVALRWFEGESSRVIGLSGFSRFLLMDGLRVSPRLRWDLRDSDFQGRSSSLIPSLEADWRLRWFLLHMNVGLEWIEPFSGALVERETNYFVEAGVRWEF
jgi:hypothetical protein